MNDEAHQLNTHRPPPSMTADTLKKIMWLYRTRTCPLNKRSQCNYGLRCFDSHESQPERRAPKQNEYNDWHPSTMKCTSNADESCKYGRACYFAHNDFEVNYHPTMYKTQLCPDFDKDGTCSLGMICPNYHYPDEQRKIEKGSLSADCKSDGISRKAPPPQEFRRWLDEELRLAKMNGIHPHLGDVAPNKHSHIIDTPPSHINNSSNINGHNAQTVLLPIHDKDSAAHERQLKSSSNIIQPQSPMNNNLNESHKHAITNHHSQIKLNEHQLHHNINPNNTTSNGIENEVEMQLPSTQTSQSLHLSHSLMEDSPSTRFISSATGSPPYVEHIDEKWHQQNLRYNNNQSRPEHYIPSVPSASPHMNRALSTPQMEHVHNELPPPSRMQHAHSHHGAPSIASYRSNRSSNRSQKSGKSSKSKSSSKSNKKRRKNGKHEKKKRSRRSLEKKRNRDKLEKQAIDIVHNYKVTRCQKSKCNDIYCVNYHNLEDRRRSPLSYNYVGEACMRIFDAKTRKFTDNCYGCPGNENCEFAHNYLEIWYHPKVFHTKRCPFMKYQKNCPWGFKCSHYHRKSQKRSMEHRSQSVQSGSIQQKYSPLSSSQYSSHSHNVQNVQQTYGIHPMHAIHPHHGVAIHSVHGAPPNLTQQNVNVTPQSLGPLRPPLTTNRVKPALINSEISSPYSANSSFSPHLNHLGLQQHQNGMLSPHFDPNINKSSPHNHQNDASYSYNPLMQGIAPSIHSWRQKMDKSVGY